MTAPLAAFDRHRRLLFSVAYQMLGSVADAEDVVQDAWLRWSAADRSDVADPRAYLVRTASRLALDRLDAARTRRESYVGPWLPEPLLTGATPVAGAAPPPDPDDAAELGEQVSLALLVVLETLTPAERAVFVLREVFGLPAAEVAATLGRSEAAVRQMAHRAREHVQARQPRFDADRAAHRAVTERFLAACAGGDVEALLAALAPDAVLVSDGGGRARAALRPITGADKVARFLVATTAQGLVLPDLRVDVADVNGAPGVVVWTEGAPFLTLSLVVVDGLVQQVLIVRNPDKLRGLLPGQPVRTADPSSSPGTAEAETGRPSR
ncbi:RNA polymerase sigma factor SigJ [Geodermatophilus sp. SYSU D00703]